MMKERDVCINDDDAYINAATAKKKEKEKKEKNGGKTDVWQKNIGGGGEKRGGW